MKNSEFYIPDKQYFTLVEIAQQWGCKLEKVESFVYDYKLLRLALVTRYIQEFKQNGKLTVNYINRKLGAAESDEDSTLRYSSENLAQEHGAVIWDSGRPEFLYLNFEHGSIKIEEHLFQTKNVRVKPNARFIFDIFETGAGDKFQVCVANSMIAIHVTASNPVITREERDRFVAAYQAKSSGESGAEDPRSYSMEHKQLLTIVGILTMALRQSTRKMFKRKGGYDNKVMARYLEEHYDGTGVTERNIPRVVANALSLLGQE